MTIIWSMVPEIGAHNFLSFWTLFCPFNLLAIWKLENLDKKTPGKLPFYTYVPYLTIISCIVPEIWRTIDKAFFHFRPSFALLPPLAAPKRNILKKWKQMLADITMLRKCTKNHDRMIICFTVPEIPRMTHVLFIFLFGFFFGS